MPKSKTFLKLLVVGCAVGWVGLMTASRAYARPEYLRIFAADPFAKAEWKTKCATCHENPAGGGPRNAFGQAFQAAGFKITPELRQKFPDRFNPPEPPKVSFDTNCTTKVIIEISGKRWVVDTQVKTMTDEATGTVTSLVASSETATPETTASTPEKTPEEKGIYRPMDDRLISLPTARGIPGKSLFVNFSHRFSLNEDRSIGGLFGLDGFANSSFGLVYGITDRIHFGFNRSPAFIGRPIEFYGGVTLADEMKGHPVSAQIRVGVEGSNNFSRNYVTSISGTVSRSLTSHAQISITPTFSINNRPLLAVRDVPKMPGENTFALGAGLAIRFRPSLAFIIEANQRLVGDLDTHRPAFGFGIQKMTGDGKHAFALTFNNSPGFTTAQRSGTRATLFGTGSPLDDTFRGLSIGFNITRRLF